MTSGAEARGQDARSACSKPGKPEGGSEVVVFPLVTGRQHRYDRPVYLEENDVAAVPEWRDHFAQVRTMAIGRAGPGCALPVL